MKDQSYFLAAVPGTAFRDVMFPLGSYTKDAVREMAAAVDIPTAGRRSSAGICFIGALSLEFVAVRSSGGFLLQLTDSAAASVMLICCICSFEA